MDKYLDKSGLEKYDEKIKEYITAKVPTKISQLKNDSGFLTNVSIPFDSWDGFGNSGSLVLPTAGWYYIFQLPGSGILFQAESNWSTKAQLFEIDTTNDKMLAIETSNSSSTGNILVAKEKTGTGEWEYVSRGFYYKHL